MKKLTYIFILTTLVSFPSYAVVTLDVFNGQLIGAKNVEVNGTFYNVAFADGTCAELFSGCNDNSDFVFSTKSEAQSAVLTLFDDVFLDTALGAFDSIPGLVQGCSPDSFDYCGSIIPYRLITFNSNDRFSAEIAFNYEAGSPSTEGVHPFGYGILREEGGSTINDVHLNYAIFTLASPVPVPATVWLFGSALVGMIGLRKTKNT